MFLFGFITSLLLTIFIVCVEIYFKTSKNKTVFDFAKDITKQNKLEIIHKESVDSKIEEILK